MKNFFKNKEIRDLVFIAVAIFMAILICISNISSENMFGIVVSIVLLALLCVGLGYQYCKNEDKISSIVEKIEKPKKEKAKIEGNTPQINLKDLAEAEVAASDIIAKTEVKTEGKKVENDS